MAGGDFAAGTFRNEYPFTNQISIVITHNAGVKPIVQIIDENACVIMPNGIEHTENDTVTTITFVVAQSGKAILQVVP